MGIFSGEKVGQDLLFIKPWGRNSCQYGDWWERKLFSWVGRGSEKEWSVLGPGCWNFQRYQVVRCFCRLIKVTREGHLQKISREFGGLRLRPVSWLFWGRSVQPGAVEDHRGSRCAASSSKGANACPVMSGVTCRVVSKHCSKQGQSVPFCWKEVCFYEQDSTWMR